MLTAFVDGWKGLRRGAPQSVMEMERAVPGSAIGPWLGHLLKPLLAPVALRSTPLPASAKLGLASGAAALLWLALRTINNKENSYA
jgi:hypothetical protein